MSVGLASVGPCEEKHRLLRQCRDSRASKSRIAFSKQITPMEGNAILIKAEIILPHLLSEAPDCAPHVTDP